MVDLTEMLRFAVKLFNGNLRVLIFAMPGVTDKW
jgi:hypothetical protein